MNIKSAFARRAVLGCAWIVFNCGSARANPRPLPFTYPYETLPEGAAEVELYSDMTPLRVNQDSTDASKGRLWEPFYRLQTEFEYGITDRWELGLYQVFEANPQDGGTNSLTFDGFKWRIRTRLAEAGKLPVDVAFYLELETMHDELALEEKVILQKRFGRLRWMGNVWVEQALERPFDSKPPRSAIQLVVNPSTGFTYELSPKVQVGFEYWARGKPFKKQDGQASFVDRRNDQVHHFLGPTAHFNLGRMWLTLGLYAHLNDADKPQPGEIYGPLWFRSVIGIDL
jgi:hypothetical protein